MSGTPSNAPSFLTAIHEAGHYITGISLGLPFESFWVTIKPFGGTAGSTMLNFGRVMPFDRFAAYSVAGLIAETVYSLCHGVFSGEIPQAVPDDALAKILDTVYAGAHSDMLKIEAREDYDHEVYGEVVLKTFAFVGQNFVDIYDLANEIHTQTTLHRDEAYWFLKSQVLYLRRHRQRSPDVMDPDGNPVRPDLELEESFLTLMQREGVDRYTEWTMRHEGAFDKAKPLPKKVKK